MDNKIFNTSKRINAAALMRSFQVGLTAILLLLAVGCKAGDDADNLDGSALPPGVASSTETDQEVEVCDLITVAQMTELLDDEIREPRQSGAAGNTLGVCRWTADNNGRSLSILAVPLSMWDELVEAEGVGPIADLGARAERLEDGAIYVDPGDRHYFVQVIVIDTDGSVNEDIAAAGANLAFN